MAELRIVGKPASSGLAAGPLALLSVISATERQKGNPVEEASALRSAMARACDQLERLAANLSDDGAEILAFQIAMLEDEALAAHAFAQIDQGGAADEAWRAALDGQIADYQTAGDEHFRARASDLADIRDRVLSALSGEAAERRLRRGAIVFAEDLTPSRFLSIDWGPGGGIALTGGSASGHVATLARARGIPMIVGIGRALSPADGDREAFIDGGQGTMILDPTATSRADFSTRQAETQRAIAAAESYRARPAVTADGERIAVLINVADPAEIEGLDSATCDGIGLVRTEFLFNGAEWPDEERQYRIYRRLVDWAAGKPVTIRTLDAGADKPIPGFTIDRESNPFLGMRGIRLSLARPEVFRVQLRALARAAAHGPLEIMLPMVALGSELEAVRSMLAAEAAALSAEGIACALPPLGIMVEVPAAAIAVELFDAAFFSIGSNDLTQYVMAAARDNHALAALNDATHPAVLRLIEQVAAHGAATGRKVSLCGDAAAEPACVAALLTAGLRALSVAPSALARVKQAIARIDLSGFAR